MTERQRTEIDESSDVLFGNVDMPPGPDGETLTVIIPCLNEESTVERTADTVFDLAPDLPVEVEVFFIDDGSTDQTLQRMEAYAERHGQCRIMSNDKNRGLGRSVLKAYERLDGDRWATVLPGDNELIFASIKNFLAIRQHYDVILGYLHNPVIRPFMRRLASESFTVVANLLYGFSFEYFNGMKLYRVGAFKGIDVVSNGHAFNPELLAKAVLRDPDLRIGEAQFLTKGRKHGDTKAFTPQAVVEALVDVYRGHQSVREYRRAIIEEQRELE
jgi:glycosyltransferase involved in cell wall biosynthesis